MKGRMKMVVSWPRFISIVYDSSLKQTFYIKTLMCEFIKVWGSYSHLPHILTGERILGIIHLSSHILQRKKLRLREL